MKRFVVSGVVVGVLLLSQAAFSQDISFSMEGACGGEVSGSAGAVVSTDISVVVGAPEGGVAGWSLSIAGEGDMVFNPDPVASCFNDCLRELLGGKGVQFHAPGIVDPEKEPDGGPLQGMGPQGPGLVVGAVLAITPAGAETLDPGDSTVLEFVVDLTIPAGGGTASLSFKDGLQGTGTPTPNSATVNNVTVTPTIEECTITLRESVGGVIPGDTDEDASLTAMDGIMLLDHYFRGIPAELPCGDGSVGDPANIALEDSNGDNFIDLADAVYIFRHIFLGGPAHVLGTDCTPISGCSIVCGG